MQRLAPILGLLFLLGLPAAAQVVPAAPQGPTALDGIDGGNSLARAGFARVTPAGSGFVDAWSHCRYVTNGGGREEVISLSSIAEWQSWRTAPPSLDAQTVCCRPITDTLCQGASGGTVTASIQGNGTNGYGLLGSAGTATATCADPPFGTFVDQRHYTCGQTGAGVNADGQWSQAGADTDTCTPNSYFVDQAGNCNAGCGGGNLWRTEYNSCGVATSAGYFGAACNTQSCCTPGPASCATCGASNTQTCTDGCNTWTQGCVCQPTYDNCGSCNGSPSKTCTDSTCGTGGSIQQACNLVYSGSGTCNFTFITKDDCYCNAWVYSPYWNGDVCYGDLCQDTGCKWCQGTGDPIDYTCYVYQ